MNENNNRQTQYPYSQQPQYPYSQQPQYPNSQQYPQSQQYTPPEPQKKGLAVWQVAVIMGGAIFLLIIIFVLLVTVRHQQAYGNNLRSYEAYENYEVPVVKLQVDGQFVDLPQSMLDINDLSYIEIGSFADVFGYKTKSDADNQQVTVSIGDRSVTFTDGNDSAIVREGNKTTTEKMNDKALMFIEEGMYVPLRSMQRLFGLKSVDWDEDANIVVVTTGE